MTGEPLAGCVFVVTADRRANELAGALERRGAAIRLAPAISTIPHVDDEKLVADTRAIIAHPPHIVVATTGIGFRGWIEAADAAGIAAELIAVLGEARLIARGPKARGAIQAAGLTADWVAESETAQELRDYLIAEGVAGQRIAVQHHGNGADGLDEAFAQAGAEVASVVVYGWGPPTDARPHLDWIHAAATGRCDAVLFTSAPAALAWLASAAQASALSEIAARSASGELLLAAVGPVTAAPLLEAGLVARFPDRWRLGALVREIVIHYAETDQPIATDAGNLVMRATTAVLDGRTLPLTPNAFAILRTLAQANGGVVTREALLEHLQGQPGDVHAVEAAINRLREAAGAKGLVRTVVKRGYALSTTGKSLRDA